MLRLDAGRVCDEGVKATAAMGDGFKNRSAFSSRSMTCWRLNTREFTSNFFWEQIKLNTNLLHWTFFFNVLICKSMRACHFYILLILWIYKQTTSYWFQVHPHLLMKIWQFTDDSVDSITFRKSRVYVKNCRFCFLVLPNLAKIRNWSKKLIDYLWCRKSKTFLIFKLNDQCRPKSTFRHLFTKHEN